MSYIRCLSNPENLYVWHDVSGPMMLSTGGNSSPLELPYSVWVGAAQKWWRECCPEQLKFKGFQLDQVRDLEFRWRLRYPKWDKDLVLYEVTLYYMWRRFSK